MTPGANQFRSLNLGKELTDLVRIECAMKKHFVYIDHIDELRHNETVIKDFDKTLASLRTLIKKIRIFRNSLNNQ